MSTANKYLVGTFLVAALLLYANAAQAMEIQKFDKMAGSDQDAYIADLVEGARRVLDQAGRAHSSLREL